MIFFLPFLFLYLGCEPVRPLQLSEGECVLGPEHAVWRLLREDQGNYLFVIMPEVEGAPVEVVRDISHLQKVECPH